MEEIWKDIPWYEWLYKINNKWVIIKSTVMKPQKNIYWYMRIGLTENLKQSQKFIHRLLASLFITNDDPINKTQVNHINWIRDDNRLENLEWATPQENINHSFNILKRTPSKSNLWKFGINSTNSKKVNQYTKDGEFIKTWDCMSDVERELNIFQSWVSLSCQWKQKTAWWFIWKYI